MLAIPLLAALLSAGTNQGRAGDARAAYEALQADHRRVLAAWSARYDGPRGAGRADEAESRYYQWPGWSFAPRFLALAQAHPDDPVAVDALLWIVRLRDSVGPGDRRLMEIDAEALRRLAEGPNQGRLHWDVLDAAARGLTPASGRFLRRLRELGGDPELRARATLALARHLANRREAMLEPALDDARRKPFERFMRAQLDPEAIRYMNEGDPAALYDEAASLFEDVIARSGDVLLEPEVRPGTLGEMAQRNLKELRSIDLGRVAPEIEGPDAAGRKLRLSDHRGQVVVLAFLRDGGGDGPDDLAPLRAMAERHAGRPLVLLGVFAGEAEALRRTIESGEITWRCWRDEGGRRSIGRRWGVSEYPTIHVLDGKGIIRHMGLQGQPLDEAVEALLGPTR